MGRTEKLVSRICIVWQEDFSRAFVVFPRLAICALNRTLRCVIWSILQDLAAISGLCAYTVNVHRIRSDMISREIIQRK